MVGKKRFHIGRVVTIEADAPERDTPMGKLLKLQGELSKYITMKDGKVSITVKV